MSGFSVARACLRVLIVAALCAHPARVGAEVTPVMFEISYSQISSNPVERVDYVVPSNKVLVVQHIFASSSKVGEDGLLYIEVLRDEGGEEPVTLYFFLQEQDVHTTLKPPLYVQGGVFLRVRVNPGADNRGWAYVAGLLADPQELFAGVPHRLTIEELGDRVAQGRVLPESPRPMRIRMFRACDLESDEWVELCGNTVRKLPAAATYGYFADRGPGDQAFFRTTTQCRW